MNGVKIVKLSALVLACSLLGTPSLVMADGIADLKSALKRLQGRAPISASIETNIVNNRGEGEDKVVKNGNVVIDLVDGKQGLQVIYGQDVLNSIDEESLLRLENEDADTPTLNAINRLEATELKSFLSSSSGLLRRIEQATFIDEQSIDYEGKSARELSFELPIEALIRDKQTREYVKKFEGSFKVIIDEHGTPLETSLDFKGKGRAYIVISVKAYGNGTTKFKVVNDRLVTVHREVVNGYDSTFGEGMTQETVSLVL